MSSDWAVFALLHPDAPTLEPKVLRVRVDRARPWNDAVSSGEDRRALVVVVEASPLRRRRAVVRLRRAGFDVTHVLGRGRGGTTQFISLDRSALGLGLVLAPARRSSRLLLWSATRGWLLKAARALLPNVLVVAVPGPRPPLHWVKAAMPGREGGASFVLALSPRGDRAYAYLTSGPDGATVVGKLGLGPQGTRRVLAEAAALRDFGPTARASGAAVPDCLHTTRIGAMPVLFESFVEGLPAARVLHARPEQLDALVPPVADWLTQWAVETSARQPPSAALADSWVAQPLADVGDVVLSGFADMLRSDAERLSREPVVTVAAHNDLTTWNVVVSGSGAMGILDWESAGTALPLMDLFYVLADAVAATDAHRDRGAAFRECFRADGSRAGWARRFVDAAARELALDPAAVALSFRLGCLRHAAADERRGLAQGFASMLRDLAAAPDAYWPMREHAD